QTGTYEVSELQNQGEGQGGDDWMTTLLQTNAFHRIPPANIQAIFLRLQRVPVRAGDVIIKQGDEGDFFYVIVSGKCIDDVEEVALVALLDDHVAGADG